MQKLVLGVLALLVALPAAPALARRGADDNSMPAAVAQTTVTRDQAIAIAKGRLDGTVKKAKLEREHRKVVWKVRIYSTDGLKRGDFRIDATTGAILREKIKTFRKAKTITEKLRLKQSDDDHRSDDGRRGRGRGSDD
jgi:hypothetical protein